jgi:hypothetical protein
MKVPRAAVNVMPAGVMLAIEIPDGSVGRARSKSTVVPTPDDVRGAVGGVNDSSA